MSAAIVAPAAVRTIDLDGPLPDVVLEPSRSGRPYRSLMAIACRGGRPVASVVLDAPQGRVSSECLSAALGDLGAVGPSSTVGAIPAAGDGLVSVAIATCGALDALERGLRSVLASDWPALDVIVIDNRPATSGVYAMLAQRFGDERRIRFVAEPRRGLSYARNAGLEHARGEIVAFTDDDVIVEASWFGPWRGRSPPLPTSPASPACCCPPRSSLAVRCCCTSSPALPRASSRGRFACRNAGMRTR